MPVLLIDAFQHGDIRSVFDFQSDAQLVKEGGQQVGKVNIFRGLIGEVGLAISEKMRELAVDDSLNIFLDVLLEQKGVNAFPNLVCKYIDHQLATYYPLSLSILSILMNFRVKF